MAADRLSVSEMRSIFAEAYKAGMAAGNGVTPTPMVVSEADGLSDRPKPGGKSWYVADGACGFAWVTIRPGGSRFARWLKKEGLANSAYGGGVSIWVRDFNQSVAKKEAAAYAMADVFRARGINASAGSRLD